MQVRKILAVAAVLSLVFVGAGCATKKYVNQNIEPMKLRVDQLDETQRKHDDSISQLNKDVETNETEISAAKERIGTVEGRVGDATTRIAENERGMNELRSRIANLDDYAQVQQVSVLFDFDKDTLNEDEATQLREVASAVTSQKRYFITVEGFTDQVGDPEYNFALSRRRADRVMRHLVAELGVPVQRIYVIGLGEERLVEAATDREARAKNRRVEVRVFSAEAPATTAKSSNE